MRNRLLRPALNGLDRLGLLQVAFATYQKFVAWSGRGSSAARQPGVPVPPGELMVLVAGSPDVDAFLEVGASMFQLIRHTLGADGVPIEELHAVLEFGCGCGRILRYWPDVPGPRVHGVDYNARLIAWCRTNLPFASYSVNQPDPPVGFEDGRFDFVYAISVFTHLSEERQLSWLRELRRILRPGGRLFITTHGSSVRDRLTELEDAAFSAGQLVVRYQSASGTNVCNAYHPEAYVRGRLSDGFSVVTFIPAGQHAGVHQDAYLLRKTASPNDTPSLPWTPRPE